MKRPGGTVNQAVLNLNQMENSGNGVAGIVIFLIILLSAFSCELDNNTPENPPATEEDSLSLLLINQLNATRIRSTVIELEDTGTRFALASNRKLVALKIRDMFVDAGYGGASLDSFQVSISYMGQDYATWQYNVSAELEGSVHPDSVNIIGAHYDDIVNSGDPFLRAPGANDNASGVAGMIEIARVMKAADYRPSISIRFVVFAAEELGLLGSTDFAAKLALSGRPVGIMINNDMIANVSTSNRLLWAVRIINYDNSEDFSATASVLCNKYVGLYPQTDTIDRKKSDSYSFFRKEYKALYITAAEPDYNYHSINDVAIDCNFNYAALISGISCALLVHYD